MDKATIKAFIAWLEQATDEEIEARIEEIHRLEQSGNLGADGKADLRLARRLIDEELIARLDLSRAADRRDAKGG